MHEGTTSATIE